jgi:trimethylamine:corrinoid methyltransferase-like protein
MSKPGISFLSQDELKAIHNASLQVLEKTGIKVMSKKVLDILGEAGAKVDYEKKSATIPANVVEEAVKRAPKTMKYGARNPRYDFMLDKKEVRFTTDGYAPFIRDFTSWQQAGSRSLDEVTKEKVREILATHKPAPLPEAVDREISRILQRAKTEFAF